MVRARAGAMVTGVEKMLPLVVLVPFALFSTFVAVEHGAVGSSTLALREPWAMQLPLDRGARVPRDRNVVQTRDSAAAQLAPTSRDPRVAHVAAQI